ncbi:MAG TPA: hypothetical protein VHM90_08340 [Phycisphaerae bacterium]|nr:hypothetical protein [Phycisphaerae bacterium]
MLEWIGSLFAGMRGISPAERDADLRADIALPPLRREAFERVLGLAEQGETAAMYECACRLLAGSGVQVDFESGRRWLELAASKGYGQALSYLAHMYLTGQGGVAQDLQLALKYAAAGNAIDDPWSIMRFGLMHYEGRGVVVDRRAAQACFDRLEGVALKRSQDGQVDAITALSALYAEKWGRKHDPHKAMMWCRKGALAGDLYSMESLGWAYLDGRGIPVDYDSARAWFMRVFDGGGRRVAAPLGCLFFHGLGGSKDLRRALEMLVLGAASHSIEVFRAIAWMYLFGIGTELNQSEGVRWLQAGANNLNDDACKKWLQLLETQGFLPPNAVPAILLIDLWREALANDLFRIR